jgi:hypothetical protein
MRLRRLWTSTSLEAETKPVSYRQQRQAVHTQLKQNNTNQCTSIVYPFTAALNLSDAAICTHEDDLEPEILKYLLSSSAGSHCSSINAFFMCGNGPSDIGAGTGILGFGAVQTCSALPRPLHRPYPLLNS